MLLSTDKDSVKLEMQEKRRSFYENDFISYMLQDNEISKSGFVEELRYEYKTGQTIRCF